MFVLRWFHPRPCFAARYFHRPNAPARDLNAPFDCQDGRLVPLSGAQLAVDASIVSARRFACCVFFFFSIPFLSAAIKFFVGFSFQYVRVAFVAGLLWLNARVLLHGELPTPQRQSVEPFQCGRTLPHLPSLSMASGCLRHPTAPRRNASGNFAFPATHAPSQGCRCTPCPQSCVCPVFGFLSWRVGRIAVPRSLALPRAPSSLS